MGEMQSDSGEETAVLWKGDSEESLKQSHGRFP